MKVVSSGQRQSEGDSVLDESALAAAFDEFARPILRYLQVRTQAADDAEDLMSVVFLEAWRSRHRAKAVDNSFGPWLFGIARNVLRTHRRSLRRHRAALMRYRNFHAASEGDIPVEDVYAVDAGHLSAQLTSAFSRLSQKDRDVADLCLVAGLSPRECAVALSIPEGTVKSRLAHGRSVLRPLLQQGDAVDFIDPDRRSGHIHVEFAVCELEGKQ
jgi:RNA polymerase sigma factor (sigma-70 family)